MSDVGQWLEAERQQQQLARAIALGSILAEILMTPPPKREHWWQFWREQ